MQDKKQIILTIVVIVIVILIVTAFSFSGNGNSEQIGQYDDFAKCVADYGLTMYGAEWCSHCLAEKKAFGDSFKYINYIECPDNIQLCVDTGIIGYPTWVDKNGKKYEGEQGLKSIAQITNCELPQ